MRNNAFFNEERFDQEHARFVNGSHFEARTRHDPEVKSPKPARTRH